MLDHGFTQVISPDVIERFAQHTSERPLECLLLKPIPARAIRKPNHVNLGGWEEPMRFRAKEFAARCSAGTAIPAARQ